MDLTARLREILLNYPENDILKELIQSAISGLPDCFSAVVRSDNEQLCLFSIPGA